jgi:hypothetical protein
MILVINMSGIRLLTTSNTPTISPKNTIENHNRETKISLDHQYFFSVKIGQSFQKSILLAIATTYSIVKKGFLYSNLETL